MPAPADIRIELAIERGGKCVFEGSTSVAKMARSFDDLVGWLARDNSFPHGVILLTGTGIVPADDFSLAAADVVKIAIAGIGTLANVGVAELIYLRDASWWRAGIAGAVMAAVFNYAVSSMLTWRK